jgi:uncharacterized protein (TIGR02001 family)
MRAISGLLAAAAMTVTLQPAMAQSAAPEFKYSFNVGITNDYVFRGFSQTAERATGQAGLDLTYGLFYAGIWGSGLDFGMEGSANIARQEIDFYAGIKPVWQGITFDLGVIYYSYFGAKDNRTVITGELDYVELKLGYSREVWKGGTFGGTWYWSPDYTNSTGSVWTGETTFAQELPKWGHIVPTVSVLYGYQKGDTQRFKSLVGNGADHYSYWNAGMTFAWEKFSLDFRYWDTNLKNNNAAGGFANNFCKGATFQCDERFVATFKFTY